MKKNIISCLLGAIVLTSLLLAGTAVAAERLSSEQGVGTPVAVVDEPVFDFGSVYGGKSVYHSFEIKNTGDAPLVIEDVKTG